MRGKRIFILVVLGLASGFAQSFAGAQLTPLHNAAEKGDKELVARLLAKGAAVNAKTDNGLTPLHKAVAAGHTEVVE